MVEGLLVIGRGRPSGGGVALLGCGIEPPDDDLFHVADLITASCDSRNSVTVDGGGVHRHCALVSDGGNVLWA